MKLEHLPSTATIEQASSVLREHGYVIIDELVPRSTMDQLVAEMQPYVDESPIGDYVGFGMGIRRTGRLIARSPTARTLVTNPLTVGVARASLAPSQSVIIGSTEMISLEPGAPAQFLHRDEMLWENFPFPDDCNVFVNSMWAATDFTEENGATRIVPGSHLDRDKEYSPEDSLPAEMACGSVLMYTGKTWHGAGDNRSAAVRRGQAFSFTAGWLRQEENQYLACPQEIARTLSEDLLRLMGYDYDTTYGYGHAGGQTHPFSVLSRA